MRHRSLLAFSTAVSMMALGASQAASAQFDRSKLPIPAEFTSTPGKTVDEAKPGFPALVKAPAGAPNVLVVMTDDVGFASASTFGGPVPTPNLDRLAADGVVYNRFHTTAMCSPTRAALLTGRNQHQAGFGTIADLATGFPGYSSMTPPSAGTIAAILKYNGYNTAMIGKHHSLPEWERWPSGPFDNWPIGLGFEQFYGFLGGDTNQFAPKLYRGNAPAEQKFEGDPDYILDRDLADEAIRYIHAQKADAPDKPFFIYYATGTAHAPHQAPKAWIEKFRGRFDAGWDETQQAILKRQIEMGIAPAGTVATPRMDSIPAWNSLNPTQKRVAARMMEAFAGALAFQDHEFGRIMDELERMGIADNTLVIFIQGDNGSSSEGNLQGNTNELGPLVNGATEDMAWLESMMDKIGGPETYGHYPIGWAWAMNTPFQWFKKVGSHLGGTRNGLVISWPKTITERGIRSQFAHVTDIVPTILEAAAIPAPAEINGVEQKRIDGVSLAYSFNSADAAERHNVQYFELAGNRAIYKDGWWANTTPTKVSWMMSNSPINVMDYAWELYDLRSDFSQSRNLATAYPEKLVEMQAQFDTEASRNSVYPIDDRHTMVRASEKNAMSPERDRYVYWGAGISVANMKGPPLSRRSFRIVADIVVPNGGGNGPILAQGSKFGGWSFYLRDGKPVGHMALSQQPDHQWEVASAVAAKPGAAQVTYDFDYDGEGALKGGDLTIAIDGTEVARGRIGGTFFMPAGLGETLDIGDDTGTTVLDYPKGRTFDGGIQKVEVIPGK